MRSLLSALTLALACSGEGDLLDAGAEDAARDVDPSLRDDPTFDGCPGDDEATAVFNAFWRELDRNYAVFDARLHPQGSTWRALAPDRCADLARRDLREVLVEMLQILDDGHSSIDGTDGWSGYEHEDLVFDLIDVVEDEYLTGTRGRASGGSIRWGSIDEVGYVYLGDMDMSEGAVRRAMEQATRDLANVTGVIFDVRANGGGFDSTSLGFATYVAGARTLAWREQERNGPGYEDFGAAREVFVGDAAEGAFDVPVVVLVSGWTFSAAETFLLAMRARDDVTLVGERTAGHLSDISAEVRLPNGWRLAYSFERYTAADGSYYEGVGIPMDLEVPLDVGALAGGRDAMLEAAIQRLRE
ncbi:MAG: S41 family peptidase [Myxococcota bacterium]